MKSIIIILAAIVFCSCGSKRSIERSVVNTVDSTAVRTVTRTEGTAHFDFWASHLCADSVHISTPEAEITVYGVNSSAKGVETAQTGVAETCTDSVTVNRHSAGAEHSEAETVAVYDPPDMAIVWIIAAAITALTAAVIIYKKYHK